MKKTITIVIVFFCLIFCRAQTNSPCVINTTGGTFQSGYYQFEWSLGEMALIGDMSNPDKSFIITNGFIQPYIQFPDKYNLNNFFGDDEIKIFPNPASEYVEINFLTKQTGRITISFYDGSGKKVYSASEPYYGVGLIKRIPVSRLPAEVYFLHVDLDAYPGRPSKKGIYKIVKIR